MGARIRQWMQSDLIGVPVTLGLIAVVALALALFFIAGPLAGLFIGLLAAGLVLYLVSRAGGGVDPSDLAAPRAESAQRLLVVANKGLANPALADELERRAARGPLDVRVIVPVVAGSRSRALADDIDAEAARGRERLNQALDSLARRGVEARGHVDDEAAPMRSLLDGLREFPADEVLLAPADELDWEDAEALADRVRAETDVRVTELDRPA